MNMFRDWEITFRASPPPPPPPSAKMNPSGPAQPPPPPLPPPPPRPQAEYARLFPPPPIYQPSPPTYDPPPPTIGFGPPRPGPFGYERPTRYEKAPANNFTWSPPPHCTGTFEWVPCINGRVPPGAVEAGHDFLGPTYVGRAFHHGDLLPAKISPNRHGALVGYAGREVEERNAEVLVSNHVAWKPARGDQIPPDAIRIGQTAYGEGLYAGRTMYQGALTPGKVHPSHGCLYIPWEGVELRFTEYEILVLI